MKVYGIREAGKKTGLSEHTLRYYEKLNLINVERNPSSNKREYTDKTIEQIEYIKALKSIGFKLQEIEMYYNLKLGGDSTILKRRELLSLQVEKIEDQIKILSKVKKTINEKISCIDDILEKKEKK